MKNNVFRFLKRVIFPPKCVFCRRIIEINSKINICGKCGDGICFTSDKTCCQKCGKPIVGYNEKQLCYFCLNKHTRYYNRIASVFTYEDLPKRAVIRFKANGYREYTHTFTDCMTAKFYEEYSGIDFDFICGAPSHDKNKGKKDFDPVDLLCNELHTKINLEYKKNVFKFTRKTDKQSKLDYNERQRNMKDSLSILPNADVSGKTVLLIDDICTTRATVIECSRALKSAGAKRVYALTLATVNNPK